MSTEFDARGYYACLGVRNDASLETIKSAYRSLAKKFHPDLNPNPSAKSQFQKITAAYAVLSDPEARNAYDALKCTKPASEPEPENIEPICCSHCGKVTAQPRATTFFQVISFLLATTKKPIEGFFCSQCATKLGLRASFISGLFGWWGFPWGPIWTIGSIFTNAMGGKKSQDITEKLTWHNAIAFFSQGKLELAYALAQQARAASDSDISSKAEILINHLRSAGVPNNSSNLRSAWSKPWLPVAHFTFLLAIPSAIGIAVAYDDITKKAQPGPTSTTNYSSYRSARATPSNLNFSDQAASIPSPTCAFLPRSGEILARNLSPVELGHSIEIRNGSSGHAIIKLRNVATGALKLAFFVRKGETGHISNLPDGNYKIQYATGELGNDCHTFVRTFSAAQFPQSEELRTRKTATQILTARLSYTLFTVPGGNVRPQSIDMASFNAD